MLPVNRIPQINYGLSLPVPLAIVCLTAQRLLRHLAVACQTVINLVVPTGYEDHAGFHSGVATKKLVEPAKLRGQAGLDSRNGG